MGANARRLGDFEIGASRRLTAPVRMLVTGDSHIGRKPRELPSPLVEAARLSDLVVHTGDFCSSLAFREFELLNDLVAVRGNNDDEDLAAILSDRLVLNVGSLEVLVVHGHLERGRSATAAVTAAYGGQFDIVIYGHSHSPVWEEVDGTHFLNPGSPLMKRREKQFSYAILSIDSNDRFDAELVRFET